MPKKIFEIRDREYTEKLLEKEVSASILLSCPNVSYFMVEQIATAERQARERAERFGVPYTEPRLVGISTVKLRVCLSWWRDHPVSIVDVA
jgi:hypothetical protein